MRFVYRASTFQLASSLARVDSVSVNASLEEPWAAWGEETQLFEMESETVHNGNDELTIAAVNPVVFPFKEERERQTQNIYLVVNDFISIIQR
jgi:hypothetical protein